MKQCLSVLVVIPCHTQACIADQSQNPIPYEILEMLLMLFI